ncbi:hypothetical protein JKG68_26010 [Microvirga aerilata]|jgi:hypothetical protein|uniref:Uncharacterized protein n=1 Tax=Microvirga aerilata TaxID=670292 RepID=A0A936ZMK9_9HYPH|nr:hypothetical protein [Microvirga aerilata]MBL0407378.1 hypothetical protein [Microvirga aerilata]
MHDVDRTSLEFNPESNFEGNQFEYGQQEWSGETYGETYGETIFNEADEAELANELLQVTNEAELDRFLGNLLSRAASAVGQVARSPIGQAVGGALKGVAKKALPLAGGAIGGYFGGPLGAKIGSGLASAAGSALGLEAEFYEQEDREFEGAKQFVRLAGTTVKQAASAPPTADPRTIAQSAAIAAARQLAPGLLQAASGQSGMATSSGLQLGMQGGSRGSFGQGRVGRWVRRGNKIILFGA